MAKKKEPSWVTKRKAAKAKAAVDPAERILPVKDPKLSKGVCVLSVALNKSWAKKPSYWVDMYLTWHRQVHFWTVIRKWKFPKDGVIEQGEAPIGTTETTLTRAFQRVTNLVNEKIDEAGYQVHDVVHFTVPPMTPEEAMSMDVAANDFAAKCNVRTTLISVQEKGEPTIATPEVTKPAEKKKVVVDTRSPFEKAKDARKKKGFWS